MNKKKGFTIPELLVVLLFATLLLVLFFVQKSNVDAMDRDAKRKTAINAMYYALEEGYYKEKGYYPEKISEEVLKVMDPALFSDPNGIHIGGEYCTYSYDPADCTDGKCKQYILRAEMEKEDTYVKRNRTY